MPLQMSNFIFIFLVTCISIHEFSFHAFAQYPEPLAIRIACGSSRNVQSPGSNKLWLKDFGYTGGIPGNGTSTSYAAPQLRRIRVFRLSDGPNNCYNVTDLPPGRYSMRAFFGVNEDTIAERESLFDVSVEGTQVLSLKPGWSIDDDASYVEAICGISDGAATLCFHSTGHGDPTVMSIEVLQVRRDFYTNPGVEDIILRTVKRVNCGTEEGKFGEYYNANPWGGDRFWAPDVDVDKSESKTVITATSVSDTSVSPNFYPEVIYQSASMSTGGSPVMTYNFMVDPVMRYSIWLHFAEIETGITQPGQRVFDVIINGQVTFPNVDIVRITGKPFSALILNKTTSVGGRALSISFRPKKHTALVSAIEIFEVIDMEKRTVNSQVWALGSLKMSLGLPLRFGWNGDPCVPQEHPWSGLDCQFDKQRNSWFIDGLGLDNQGLRGFLSDDISNLKQLQSLNLSGNGIYGSIPSTLGTLKLMEYLDLSFNKLNGTIPESLGNLTQLRKLYVNGNQLSGQVPLALDSMPIRGASFNFTENPGLCGVPGLPSCGNSLSAGSKAGIAIGVILLSMLICIFGYCMWKRRQNILRAKRAGREAPYAKARTHFTKDVQMSRPPYVHEQFRAPGESGPQLLVSTPPLIGV